MLTGTQVRVRLARDKIVPRYLDVNDPQWLETAERLRTIFKAQEGQTRGTLEEELKEAFESDPEQLVTQGLAKLLEDRCDFETVSGHPPEQLRELVFEASAKERQRPLTTPGRAPFDRQPVLQRVADQLGLTAEAVDLGLFADLKSEQKLIRFADVDPRHLLDRYNVALAQSVLLRSTRVQIEIWGERPARYRQLLGRIKFHRLLCQVARRKPEGYCLTLDGPLSLFSATQKYGLQLALFLPSVLHCQGYALRAELLWGPKKTRKVFTLTPEDGLKSHQVDAGTYVPPELGMFVELFRKKVDDWEISEEAGIFPLGDGFWTPDYRLTEKASGKSVLLEVLGFWRRSSLEKHLERLRRYASEPFLLAVSDQLHVEDAALENLPARVHRFRQMPLPDELVESARALIH